MYKFTYEIYLYVYTHRYNVIYVCTYVCIYITFSSLSWYVLGITWVAQWVKDPMLSQL